MKPESTIQVTDFDRSRARMQVSSVRGHQGRLDFRLRGEDCAELTGQIHLKSAGQVKVSCRARQSSGHIHLDSLEMLTGSGFMKKGSRLIGEQAAAGERHLMRALMLGFSHCQTLQRWS